MPKIRRLLGQTLGERYRLDEVLSSGDDRCVFSAFDTRLRRGVAVKVISGDHEAFLDEVRNCARLPHHPHLVPVYDYGTDAMTGVDYYTSELLIGQTLAEKLAHSRNGLKPEEAVHVLVGVCSGLAVLHRCGLTHCNLSPDHIFLVGEPEDFYEVRVIGLKSGGEQYRHATVSENVHTSRDLRYLAPEQLRGDSQITPASDIYSVGLVGLELLSGTYPAWVNNAFRNDAAERAIARLLHHRPETPLWLTAILRRCLRVEPLLRFATAEELGDSIREKNADLYPTPDPTPLSHNENSPASTPQTQPASWRDIFKLEPNVFGFGLDLKVAWRLVERWYRGRSRS